MATRSVTLRLPAHPSLARGSSRPASRRHQSASIANSASQGANSSQVTTKSKNCVPYALWRHRSRFTLAQQSRSQNHVGPLGKDGSHQFGQQLGVVAVVRIQKNDDRRWGKPRALLLGGGRDAGEAGRPVTATRLVDNRSAVCPSYIGRVIGRAVVDDDYTPYRGKSPSTSGSDWRSFSVGIITVT